MLNAKQQPTNTWSDTIASYWKSLAGLGIFFTGVATAWYLSSGANTGEIAINGFIPDLTVDLNVTTPMSLIDTTPEFSKDVSQPTTHQSTQRHFLSTEIAVRAPIPVQTSFDPLTFFPNTTSTITYDGDAMFRDANNEVITWRLYDEKTGNQTNWVEVENESDGKKKVKFSPDFSDAGNHRFVVEAENESGDTASDVLPVTIQGKPVFVEPLPNHQITVGEVWNYFIPQGVVNDPNKDPLSYRAQLVGGGLLPKGLNFDSRSGTFSGLLEDSGSYEIEVFVSDGISEESSTTFTLTATRKPEINIPILDPLPGRENKLFNFAIPKNAFISPDASELIYEVSQENGLPIPAWLQFNKNTLTFTGTPPEDSATEWLIKIAAINPQSGSSVTQTFKLRVDPNFAPQLKNAISTQYAAVGETYLLDVSSTFKDPNLNDTLGYSASRTNGKGLPKGLRFFPNSKTFYWKPGRDAVGDYEPGIYGIRLSASDGEKSAFTDFQLIVNGMGNLELSFKIVFPALSIIITLIGCWLKRAYCLDRINPEGYRRLGLQLQVGETGTIDLGYSKDEIGSVSLVPKAEKYTGRCETLINFFGSRYQSYPTGEFPPWMVYRLGTHQLEITGSGPSQHDVGEWLLVIKNPAGTVLAEMPIEVIDPAPQERNSQRMAG